MSSPDISGDTSRRFGLDVRDRTSLRVSARGTWPDIGFDGELAGPAVHVALRGRAHVEKSTRITASLDARDVDLSRLLPDGPSSALATHAELTLFLRENGTLEGDYRVTAPAGRIAAAATPPVDTKGRVVNSEAGELRVDGQATVDEPGALVEVAYRLRSEADTLRAHAELVGRLRNPPRLAALGVRTSGTLKATADFDTKSSLIDAEAKLRLFDRPSRSRSRGRRRAGFEDSRQALRARHPRQPHGGPRRSGRTAVSARRGDGFGQAVGTRGERARRGLVAGARRARDARFTRARHGARRTRREGFRRATAPSSSRPRRSFSWTAGFASNASPFAAQEPPRATLTFEETVRKSNYRRRTSTWDASPVSPVSACRSSSALVSADVSIQRAPGALNGHARARVRDVKIGKLEGATAALDLAFTPKNVSGTAEADFGEGGRFQVELDRFEPPREPWTLERFAEQPGSVVARGELRLSGFQPVVAASDSADSSGSQAPRRSKSPQRVAAVRVATRSSKRASRRRGSGSWKSAERPSRFAPSDEARALEPRALEGVDVKLFVAIEPEQRSARLDLELFDAYGTIAAVKGDTRLPEQWPRTLGRAWRTPATSSDARRPAPSVRTLSAADSPGVDEGDRVCTPGIRGLGGGPAR